MSTVLLENHNPNIMSTSPSVGYNEGIGGDTMPTYTVVIHKDNENGGYWATCKMPKGGVNTMGDTLKEVQSNMFEAMDLFIEDHPDITDYFLQFETRNE